MKKTIRTLSMVMMALAMALCFLFAGLTFVRADETPELENFSGIDTAAVFLVNEQNEFDANETGIKFTAKIKKTDYYALTGGVDAKGNTEVHLGVEVVRANADGTYTTLPNAHYTVDTAGTFNTYNVGGVELNDYFMYSFTVKYNLNRIFGENFDAKDETIAKNINFMYSDELCIRPFYQVISEVDGAGPRVYGEYGASRSMIHVAVAEYFYPINLKEENKEAFISKYVSVDDEGKACIEDKGEIEVYADGSTNIEYDKENAENNPVTYTIGTSAKVVARADGKIDASALKGYAYNDTFQLFGYTADRRVYTYNATFKGVEGIEGTKVYDDILYDVTSGKYFLNNTALENEEVLALYGLDNEKLSAEEINNLPLGESVNLKVVTNKGVYNAVNFKPYTMVFENTKESRELMVQTFYTADYKLDIPQEEQRHEITGVYALAENIYFDYNVYDQDGNVVEGKYNTKEAFYNPLTDHTVDEVKTYYDPNIFRATFDGRGYALNNILRYNGSYQSMFGIAGDGAVLKNIAFNNAYKVTGSSITQDKSYEALLFYGAESAEAKLTLHNVYIYTRYTSSQGTGSLLYYDSSVINVFDLDNVFIVTNNDFEGDKKNPAFIHYDKTLAAGSVVNDVYIVANSSRANFKLSSADAANSSNYAFYKIEKVDDAYDFTTTLEQKLAEFKAANHDYSGFDAEYWTIIDGIPAWNSINTVAKIKDSTLKVQKEISSITAGEKFTISVEENGEEITSAYEIVNVGDEVVTVSGNEVTVNANVKGSATVIVKVAGEEVARFDVTVDTREAEDNNEEVLLSKADGKLYFNNTSLAGAVVSAVAYNDNSIFDGEKVDASEFTVNSDEPYALSIVTTTDMKYNLTNVMVYDGVYAQENRKEFMTLFNFTGELYGYYVLAENITFEDADGDFAGHSLTDVFGGTLDGRGYTLNNIYMPTSNAYGVFGGIPGANTVIKNIGINRLFFGSNEGAWGSTNHSSLFFRDGAENTTVTMENVYVYIHFTATTYPGRYFYNLIYGRNGNNLTTFNLSKVIIINEYDPDTAEGETDSVGNTTRSASLGYAEIPGTATNTYYITNGANYNKHTYTGLVSYGTGADATLQPVIDKMIAANNDYTSFSTDYWTVAEGGIPVWNSLIVTE